MDNFQWTDELVSEFLGRDSIHSGNVYADIELFKQIKQKQPLFKTEDGVEKFEGDDTRYVDTERWEIGLWASLPNPLICENKTDFSHYVWFDKYKAAEQYILYNKPCLSLKEVVSEFKSLVDKFSTFSFEDKIMQLAEQKINNK